MDLDVLKVAIEKLGLRGAGMARIFLFTLMFFCGHFSYAALVSIKPGETTTAAQTGDVISCDSDVETCSVEFQYVGRSSVAKLPNGKVHFESKDKEEVFKAAKALLDMKVCGRLKIDLQD